MRQSGKRHNALDVRAKLLLILGVLSLPVLIVSLFQLHSYQKSIAERSAAIARIEAEAAATTIESWAAERHIAAANAQTLSQADAEALNARLARLSVAGGQTTITVFDAAGHALMLQPGVTALAPETLPTKIRRVRWSDGVSRVTSATRADASGWSVAVGVPAADTGRSILLLTAAWALALSVSSMLAVWAVGRFTRPLRTLAAAASTIGEGNLGERARVETEDEVGTLAESFNAMAESLESKFEAVERQSAFIGEVLDSLPLGVVVLDAKLVVRKVNSAFAGLTGRAASEITGRGLYEAAAGMAVLSEAVEDVRRTRRAFVNYGQPLDLAARAGGDEAQKFWDVIVWPVMEQSEGRGDLIVILSEVSKRVRAERMATAAFAAEKSRAAELASVINQMVEGVVIVDADGRYRVNRAAARILGREPGEFRDGVQALLTDMALRDREGRLLAPEQTPISRASERGEFVSGEQYKLLRRDGEERVLSASATPLVGDGGRAEGVVAVFRDITEEVRSHDELLLAYERLREHDRMKSAFVGSMSHELRTPLNVIIGMCQLLARDPSLPLAPSQHEAVTRMERNGRALLEIVNGMLDYSRLEAGRSAMQIEELGVGDIVDSVAASFADEAREKNIELTASVSPELGSVSTDRRRLTQVITCLVSNALKFTSAGRVHVEAAPDGEDRWYIEVTDTGIGISGDALSYIFDDFRQVDDRLARSFGGVGLGLALTRKIVELLEGKITVDSRPDEGSRFRVTWPREAQPRTGTGSLVSARGLSSPEEFERRLRAV
ncbi:MAG TPA: ATP-binding protein [Pyrinomonadaceae bacterium]|nr:ATP-binding protein [Pyrinomonadaceae bacterium]